jgi:hypothetical protein
MIYDQYVHVSILLFDARGNFSYRLEVLFSEIQPMLSI